ncbi:MAG: ribonuclease HII [Christensenellales bacterium]
MKLTDKIIERTKKLVEYDKKFACQFKVFCGIDEAGRGPLAGPVVVASCIMPLDDDKIIYGIYDSKQVTEKNREELFEQIKNTALAFDIQEVSQDVIDEINILQATKLGMKRVIENLKIKPQLALIDAVANIDSDVDQVAIIKGDATSYSIACASILAKVYRDHLMQKYDEEYKIYGFAKHKGYGTSEHIAVLKEQGPCKLHRKTFIKNFVRTK